MIHQIYYFTVDFSINSIECFDNLSFPSIFESKDEALSYISNKYSSVDSIYSIAAFCDLVNEGLFNSQYFGLGSVKVKDLSSEVFDFCLVDFYGLLETSMSSSESFVLDWNAGLFMEKKYLLYPSRVEGLFNLNIKEKPGSYRLAEDELNKVRDFGWSNSVDVSCYEPLCDIRNLEKIFGLEAFNEYLLLLEDSTGKPLTANISSIENNSNSCFIG